MSEEERESLYLPNFGVGHVQSISEHKSRKRKQPLGFAPSKFRPKPRPKRKR